MQTISDEPTAIPQQHTLSSGRARLLGYCAAALGAAFFATKAIFVKLAYAEGVDAETFLALRMGIAAPFFLIVFLWALKRRGSPIPKKTLWAVIGIGCLGYYGASLFDFLGLEYISANLERVILLTYPMMVIFLGALFFKTPLKAHAIGAALLSYAGLAILFLYGAEAQHKSDQLWIGVALVLTSALAYALYQLFAKGLIHELGGTLFTSLTMLSAAAGTFVHFVLTHPMQALLVNDRALVQGVLVGIVATVVPSFLISHGLKHAGSQATAVLGTISPLITIVLAIWILKEPFGLIEAIGSALVVGAVALFTFWDMRDGNDQTKGPTTPSTIE